jgi:hypothetical protein
MGLDKMKNPLMLLEEKDGKLVLEPATAVPIRDIPAETMSAWILEDEASMEKLKG